MMIYLRLNITVLLPEVERFWLFFLLFLLCNHRFLIKIGHGFLQIFDCCHLFHDYSLLLLVVCPDTDSSLLLSLLKLRSHLTNLNSAPNSAFFRIAAAHLYHNFYYD